MGISKTAQALDWLAADGARTAAEAAKLFDITPGAISHALKKKANRCPHCGQVMSQRAQPGPKAKS